MQVWPIRDFGTCVRTKLRGRERRLAETTGDGRKEKSEIEKGDVILELKRKMDKF